jgi:hypothetical protein
VSLLGVNHADKVGGTVSMLALKLTKVELEVHLGVVASVGRVDFESDETADGEFVAMLQEAEARHLRECIQIHVRNTNASDSKVN